MPQPGQVRCSNNTEIQIDWPLSKKFAGNNSNTIGMTPSMANQIIDLAFFKSVFSVRDHKE